MISTSRRALIVVDVQNDYVAGKLPIEYPDVSVSLRNIGRAMVAAREARIPVIVVQTVLVATAPMMARGTSGAELHEIVRCRPHDLMVEKTLPSALAGTPLLEWLRQREIDTIAVVGYMTHNCDDSTIRHAVHAGLAVEFLADAAGAVGYANRAGLATAEEIHRVFTVVAQSRFAAVMTTDEWIAMLRSGGQPERDDIFGCTVRARRLVESFRSGTGGTARPRVAIVTFSPAGSTRKVGAMLAASLESRGCASQLVDVTRDPAYFAAPDRTAVLDHLVGAHDVLCVGGPVYAHHMQFNVLDLVRRLPRVGGRWGRLAVPFVTYGGLTSGRALYDTARALRRTSRRVVLAMKVNSFHSVTREFATRINEGMPGEEARPLVDELAARISGLRLDSEPTDVTRSLNYQDARNRLKDMLLFHERGIAALAMPTVTFVPDKCSACGLCVHACPVQRLEMQGGCPARRSGGGACIHCSECVFACRRGAVRHSMRRFEKPILAGGRGRGLLASHEMPRSAVYAPSRVDGDSRVTADAARRDAAEDAA